MQKILAISLLAVIFSSISFIEPIPKITTNVAMELSIFDQPVMCSDRVGKCVGSIYCTVCTNCSRCGYCKGGGSCGVCGKEYYTKPKAKTKTPKKARNNNEVSNQKSSHQPAYLTQENYVVLEKTSLRMTPNSKATILTRLSVNDKVQMLDGNSEKYWCKVSFDGEIGWVKKHLLKKIVA